MKGKSETTLPVSEELLLKAERLKAVGSPMKLKILFLLREEGKLRVKDIIEELGEEQSKVSQHLRDLRFSKLVNRKRKGVEVFYSPTETALEILKCVEKILPKL